MYISLPYNRFTDKLTITIIGGISYTVSLSAEGKGTTIVSVPSMHSSVNMGTHFACSQVRKQFTLTNRGRRSQVCTCTCTHIVFKILYMYTHTVNQYMYFYTVHVHVCLHLAKYSKYMKLMLYHM